MVDEKSKLFEISKGEIEYLMGVLFDWSRFTDCCFLRMDCSAGESAAMLLLLSLFKMVL